MEAGCNIDEDYILEGDYNLEELSKNTNIITGHTDLYCLLGSPVSHSVSPMMHNAAFNSLGIDARYLCFDVAEDKIGEAVTGIKTFNIKGFNCTMPLKNKIVEYLDNLSIEAEMIGAVNTVKNENGILTGYNTDGYGYMNSIKISGFNPEGKTMTLLGAGGAASSIMVQAALDNMACINVFSRKSRFWERAQGLVDRINSSTKCKANLFEMPDEEMLKKCIGDSDILTNATTVGMAPDVGCLIGNADWLHEGLLVSDIIYNPRKTPLLKMAETVGCRAVNGMDMLLFQGAKAFEIWTGKEMPTDKIRTEIMEKYM